MKVEQARLLHTRRQDIEWEVQGLSEEELVELFDELQHVDEALRAASRSVSSGLEDGMERSQGLATACKRAKRGLLVAQATARAYLAAVDAELLARGVPDDVPDDADERLTEPPGETLDVGERVENVFYELIELFRVAEPAQRALSLQAMRAVVRCSPKAVRGNLWHRLVREVPDEGEALWAGIEADLGADREPSEPAPPAGGAP